MKNHWRVLFVVILLLYASRALTHGVRIGMYHVVLSCALAKEEFIYVEWSPQHYAYKVVVVSEQFVDCVKLLHLHESTPGRHRRLLRETDNWLIERVEKLLDCSAEEVLDKSLACGSTIEDKNSDNYPVDWLQHFLRDDLISKGELLAGDCDGENITGCTKIAFQIEVDEETEEWNSTVASTVSTVDFVEIYKYVKMKDDKRLAIGELCSTIFHERYHHKWPSLEVVSLDPPKTEEIVDDHETVRQMNVKSLQALFDSAPGKEDWALEIFKQ